MSYGWPILSTVTFLPLVGALLIFALRGDDDSTARNARYIALWTTLITFAISLLLWRDFDPTTAKFQFVEERSWLGPINFHMGVDGISMPFLILTTLLMPITVLSTYGAIKTRVREFMIAFLILETLMLGVFCSLDLVMFYLFFEGGLIPMFLIIGIWGGTNRVYASFKFFLYTLAGSLLMLLAIMAMYWEAGTTNIPQLLAHDFPPQMQTWLWLAFFASFAVKLPMWPVHTWLPDAHVQAPTAGSVVLAGILLKLGGYGFLRFSIPMFPLASVDFAPLIYALSVIAVIYTSLVALAQEDMKKLIAYSSIAHMGFVTIGIFTLTMQGLQGGIFLMLSHGLVSAGLFLCVGVVYDRAHTREINGFGGLGMQMPLYFSFFSFALFAALGLPGLSGFVSEAMIFMGIFPVYRGITIISALGIIIGAAYVLWMLQRVFLGPKNDKWDSLPDINAREMFTLVPIGVIVLLLGVYPMPVLNLMKVTLNNLIKVVAG